MKIQEYANELICIYEYFIEGQMSFGTNCVKLCSPHSEICLVYLFYMVLSPKNSVLMNIREYANKLICIFEFLN